MKTFKQHIKEGGQMGVGTTSHSASVEDTVMGLQQTFQKLKF